MGYIYHIDRYFAFDWIIPCPVSECNGRFFFVSISNDANGIVLSLDELVYDALSILLANIDWFVFGEVDLVTAGSSFFVKTANFSFILNLFGDFSWLIWLLIFVQ